MANLKLQLKRQSERNGMAAYKADNQRSTGTVYFDRKMFNGAPPAEIEINAEGIVVPAPKAEPAPAQEVTDGGTESAAEETVGV